MNDIHKQDTPWYRNPMVWMVIFFPAVAVVAGLSTVYIAVATSDGLVEDDYYKQGLQINRVIDRDHRAQQLGVHAQVQVDTASGEIQVRLTSAHSLPTTEELAFRLVHRTIPGLDQQTNLAVDRTDPARFAGFLRPPIGEGRWTILLQSGDEWRLKKSFMTRPGQARIEIDLQPR